MTERTEIFAFVDAQEEEVGKVTEKQMREIAAQKMPDLNAASVDAAVKSIKGRARSLGIEVVA